MIGVTLHVTLFFNIIDAFHLNVNIMYQKYMQLDILI